MSSFVASLLTGSYCGIDYGDGSGMNLLNMKTKKWDETCLSFLGEGALEKLGDPIPGNVKVGKIHSYFVEKYGLSPECIVGAFTGDNLNSLASLRLSGDSLVVSLGTSDTIFGITKDPIPGLEGHIFCNPLNDDEFVGLLCFSNGSLAREKVRDEYANHSWKEFDSNIDSIAAGCDGHTLIEWSVHEITPNAMPKRCFFRDAKEEETHVVEKYMCRAMIEGQMLRLRHHLKSIGITNSGKLIATGGASQNKCILQIAADVFGVPVFSSTSNSAALGGCFRALDIWNKEEKEKSFFEATKHIKDDLELVCNPDMEKHNNIYVPKLKKYPALLKKVLVF